jgi:nitroreductase
MDFARLVDVRCSVRAYRDEPVEEETIRAVLEAANAAPSAGNLQAFEIVMVTEPDVRAALARAALDQDFIAKAPVVLVFLASPRRSSVRYHRRGEDLYCIQDATIACAFAHLRAADLGLGSAWVGAFHDDKVVSIIGAPGDLRPVAILSMGHPGESPPRTSRRSLDDVVHKETF